MLGSEILFRVALVLKENVNKWLTKGYRIPLTRVALGSHPVPSLWIQEVWGLGTSVTMSSREAVALGTVFGKAIPP